MILSTSRRKRQRSGVLFDKKLRDYGAVFVVVNIQEACAWVLAFVLRTKILLRLDMSALVWGLVRWWGPSNDHTSCLTECRAVSAGVSEQPKA